MDGRTDGVQYVMRFHRNAYINSKHNWLTNRNIPSVWWPFSRKTSSESAVCIHGKRRSG